MAQVVNTAVSACWAPCSRLPTDRSSGHCSCGECGRMPLLLRGTESLLLPPCGGYLRRCFSGAICLLRFRSVYGSSRRRGGPSLCVSIAFVCPSRFVGALVCMGVRLAFDLPLLPRSCSAGAPSPICVLHGHPAVSSAPLASEWMREGILRQVQGLCGHSSLLCGAGGGPRGKPFGVGWCGLGLCPP